MEGVPGSGKSTLAEMLVEWVATAGGEVDHLSEEAIFNRPEFSAVGQAFKTKRFPTPDLMLFAYDRLFAKARDRAASVVADWNAVGMIEDLPCAQPDRASTTTDNPLAVADSDVLRQHALDVRRAWGGQAVLLRLAIPVEEATRRAAQQRGSEWISRQLARAGRSADGAEAIRAIAEWHAAYGQRRRVEVQSHADAGWAISSIDAGTEPAVVLKRAVAATYPDA